MNTHHKKDGNDKNRASLQLVEVKTLWHPYFLFEFMLQKFWIWIRIVGWILLLSGSLSLLITSAFDLLDYRSMGIGNGLLTLTGTFFVLYGYYQLERDRL